MTLEEFTAQLNGSTFWKEFTFSQNQFSPRPGEEMELADNIVWLGETAFVIQMKEREQPTDNADVERRWFKNKVRGKAISQVKDSIGFLREHESISIANGRGRRCEVRGADIRHLEKIVLYAGGPSLPEDCRSVRYHVSETAGFIHIFERTDYSLVLETLAVPEEIRRYLEYRQNSLLTLTEAKVSIVEADVLAAYLSDEALPSPLSHKALDRLVDDSDQVESFFLVMLPNIGPSVASASVFAFLASFDDATVSFFISDIGGKSIGRKMFEDIDFNLTPVIAAASTVLVAISLALMTAAQLLTTRNRH